MSIMVDEPHTRRRHIRIPIAFTLLVHAPLFVMKPSSSNAPVTLILLVLLVTLAHSPCAAQPSVPLTNDVPRFASMPAASALYFTFTTTVPTNTLLVSAAASLGYPALYASNTTAQPTASTAQYSASYLDGGAIAVASAGAGVWYLAVNSSAYSACNFTIVASSYDPTVASTATIPLSNAEPQASAVAAGEYRYFTFTVSTAGATQLSIADTQAVSATILIVVNGPGNAALPTATAADYSTANSTLQLLTITGPAVGVYTVGVWSATTTAFTLMAVMAGSIQPMEYGVVYPGYVGWRQWRYYSVYIDSLQLPTTSLLTFSLYSLTGDADLVCSSRVQFPNQTSSQWQSSSTGSLTVLSVPGPQLTAGLVFCGVYGFLAASYTFSAAFQGYTVLSPNDLLYAQTTAAAQSLYSVTVEGNSSTVGSIVLSVSAEVGSTAVYVQPYPLLPLQASGQAWSSAQSWPMQALVIPIADACRLGAIAGSDPPQCGLNILVASAAASVYRIAVDVGQSGAILLPGQPMAGAVTAGGLFFVRFSIPNNLSNVTLLLTFDDDSANASLNVGPTFYQRQLYLWSVQQTAGNPVLYWALDWTDPHLPYRMQEQGTYLAYVTAPVGTTFTILYTVTNSSGYNGSPTQLASGQPQYGLLPAGHVNFYTFAPPAAGWPYNVVLSVAFTSGLGYLWATSGAPPSVASITARWAGPLIYLIPDRPGVCNANTTLNSSSTPCQYALTVQAALNQSQPVEYYVTATAGQTLQSLVAPITVQSVVAAGTTAYYSIQTSSYGRPAKLLAACTMQQGQAVLFASNISTMPNASTAQQQASVLSSAIVSTAGSAQTFLYYYVAVQCEGSVDCVFSLQINGYVPSQPGWRWITLSAAAAGISFLQAAGDTLYYYIVLGGLGVRLPFVLVQLQPVVGSATLYVTTQNVITPASLPSPVNYQWTAAGPGTALVEIVNSSLSAFLVMAAQAGPDEDALYTLSANVAGVESELTADSGRQGLLTPAFPISFYRFTLPWVLNSTVLSFGVYSTSCPSSTQLYVSDTVQYPGPGTAGVDYNYTAAGITLSGGRMVINVAVTSATLPAGSLHPGYWYLAVVGAGLNSSCLFTVSSNYMSYYQLQQDTPVRLDSDGFRSGAIYAAYTMQPETAVSFGLTFPSTSQGGIMTIYAAVGNMPVAGNSSTYVTATNYVMAALPAVPPAIYLPASLCPATPQSLLSGCQVMLTARTTVQYQLSYVTTMSAAASATLTEEQSVLDSASQGSPAYYQFPVPAASGTVTVAISSTVPVQVLCSFQFIRPSPAFYDWSSTVTATSGGRVVFSWDAPQLNAIQGVAQPAQSCYCSVAAINGTAVYSLSYSWNTGSAGLSSTWLFVAIFVPLVVALTAAAVLLWYRRRSDSSCREMLAKALRSDGTAARRRPTEDSSDGPISELQPVTPVTLTQPRVTRSSLLDRGAMQSDAM